ncbi:hypothetical protein [Microbacterium sp. KNMS]
MSEKVAPVAVQRPEFSVTDRVMSTRRGRRLGTVKGIVRLPDGGVEYVVRWLDDDSKSQVPGERLVRRFTSQSVAFSPKREEREDVAA